MSRYQSVSQSLEDTFQIAKNWLGSIAGKKNEDGATIVGLSGHLGAGKTAFVKQVARELGIKEEVTSPTFVLMKFYEVKNNNYPWKRLVHMDAYRLERREELDALRFEEVASDPGNIVLVEWPEQVGLEYFGEIERIAFEMRDKVCTIKFGNALE